jgi:two-component system response regulator
MINLDPVECLIVEDNPSDAELTISVLKKNNLANELFLAEDGQEARNFIFCNGRFESRLPTKPLKVIFPDLKLPEVSGLEILKEIKSNPLTKKLPVVILTSSKEDPDIEAAYEYSANNYVVKPVDFNDFVKALQIKAFFGC